MRARLGLCIAAVLLATAAARAQSVPFALVDNRILIPVEVNGVSGFTMIFDTGATGLTLTPRAAERLHLHTKPAGTVGGAGAGRPQISSGHVDDVAVAGEHLGRAFTIVLDLDGIRRAIGFPHVDGILGYDVLHNFAVGVDMDAGTFALAASPPAAVAGETRTRFTIRSGLLDVPAEVDGIAARFIIDAGDRSSLTLFEPFARSHGFYDVIPSLRGVVTGYGVGGWIDSNVFRSDLRAFGYRITRVLTRAPIGNAGVFDSTAYGGSIGNGFLRRFNVVYDLPRDTLIVRPRREYAGLERFDPAGMWISIGAFGPTVTSVVPKGPAARAGIAAGETVLAVDGNSTIDWSPPQLRGWLASRAPGSTVVIALRDARGSRVVRSLTVRDLI